MVDVSRRRKLGQARREAKAGESRYLEAAELSQRQRGPRGGCPQWSTI